jgi:NADP-dependent 3-hydroxy acid dehydrogenase YdfG
LRIQFHGQVDLYGKVDLITGAGRLTGRAIAQAYAGAGAEEKKCGRKDEYRSCCSVNTKSPECR